MKRYQKKYLKEGDFINRTVVYNDRILGDQIGKIIATKAEQGTFFYKIEGGPWIENDEIIKCMD